MRTLLFLALFYLAAFGSTYNDLLIKAQASIFPKILLLSNNLDEKLVNGMIVYSIVYRKEDYATAHNVRNLVTAYYNEHLDQYDFEVRLVKYSDLSSDIEATAIYALNSNKNIRSVTEIAASKGIMTFSYDIEGLKEGVLFSIVLEKFTVIYLHKQMLQDYHIDFLDSLYQIVSFYNTNENN